MRIIGNRILGGALAAWLLALVSCGTAPTAPRMDGGGNPAAGSQETSALPGGESHEGLIVAGEEPGPNTGTQAAPVENKPRVIGTNGLELVQPVTGNRGASLRVAGVTVILPPDAIDGDAEIKITVPDSTKLKCHLEIFPASKNHFSKPVRLEFDVRGARDPRVIVVFWFDETAKAWVPLTTSMDPSTGKIWADLSHFSIYMATIEILGRAGW
ncbi:MAG: hypothetical protein ABIS67_14910 [Candidatus Eisenbacteria bacterium]